MLYRLLTLIVTFGVAGLTFAGTASGAPAASAAPAGKAGPARRAPAVKIDPPIRVVTARLDNSRLAGRLSSYDDYGFQLLDDKAAATTVGWTEVTARNAMEVFSLALAKGTADDWVRAGKVMYWLRGGEDFGERAFAKALRMDPKVQPKIDAAKKEPPGTDLPGDAGAIAFRTAILNRLWGKLPDDIQAESVAHLKKFVAESSKGKDGSLKLVETKYFLFYSDLPPDEAKKWSSLLDRMYTKLSDLFAVPRGTNVWRGKCLIIVFNKPEDYRAFEKESEETDAGKSAGMCHSYLDGYVHIAFYRQKSEVGFAHVLVHESVHGFIHRYRSYVYLPSWANEGLAEVIASELVPHQAWEDARRTAAKNYAKDRGVGPKFFDDDKNIEFDQYEVAEALCSYMITTNKRGYVAFINGVKDGLSVEESLKKNYATDLEGLTAKFLESLKGKK